ncbi:MAG: PQQ-binding-like beta-propeller repeat protein, partial [Planctomyces sp.]
MKWLTRSFTGLLAGLICLECLNAEDWPGWRGPRGDGVSLEQTAPVTWGPTENLRWKVPVPGSGRSSVVISGPHAFLTTGTADDLSRRVLCFDSSTGNLLWNSVVHQGPGGKMHQDNTMASSTPAVDAQRIYAVFVDDVGMTVAALDRNGQ